MVIFLWQTDGLQKKVTQLESDNQLLLQSKINLGKQVEDLTDELNEMREKCAKHTEPKEVGKEERKDR